MILAFPYRLKRYRGQNIHKILIVKLDEIGDMIYATPVFHILKTKFPDSEITVWCRPVASGILENNPYVDRIVHLPPSGRFHLWLEMRGNHISLFRSLISFPAFRYDRASIRLKNKLSGGQKQELYTNLEIIRPLLNRNEYDEYKDNIQANIFTSPQNHLRAEFFIEKNGLGKFGIMHTGARDPNRRWPIERFAELARQIHQKLQIQIVIAGGPEEAEFVNKNLSKFPEGTVSFCGKGSLTDLKALCDACEFFIGNESGPLHIAALSNKPTIGLFGKGVHGVFYPKGNWVRVIHYLNRSKSSILPEDKNPTLYISVAEVWGNLVQLLNQIRSRP